MKLKADKKSLLISGDIKEFYKQGILKNYKGLCKKYLKIDYVGDNDGGA